MKSRFINSRNLASNSLGTITSSTRTNDGDPYWSNVSLLLKGDGAGGVTNTTIVDTSSYAKTITNVSNISYLSPNTPFVPGTSSGIEYTPSAHGGSIVVASNSNVSSAWGAEQQLGNGSFTLEFWMKLNSVPAAWNPVFQWGTTAGGYSPIVIGISNDSKIAAGCSTTGGAWVTLSSVTGLGSTLVANTWYHIAVERISGSANITVYLNGTSIGVMTLASGTTALYAHTNTEPIRINNNGSGPAGLYTGIRGTVGAYRYGGNFTPPAMQPKADANTVLCITGSNIGIYDSAGINNVNTGGNSTISVVTSKFGGSSLYFDGAGDYLLLSPRAELGVGAGDFTIETWFYPVSLSVSHCLLDIYDGNSAGRLILQVNSGGAIQVSGTSGGALLTTTAMLTNNQWNHIAVVRAGGYLTVYVNGTAYTGAQPANSTTFTCTTGNVSIGVIASDLATAPVNGYLDDFRITKGIARYTANFTPTVKSFPAFYKDAQSDPYYSNVSFLGHSDGANTSTNSAVVDTSGNTYTITPSGSVSVVGTSPFGYSGRSYNPDVNSGSIWFKGNTSNDGLKYTEQVVTTSASNLTVECWILFTALPTANWWAGNGSWTGNAILFKQSTAFNIVFGSNNLFLTDGTSDVSLGVYTWAVNTWYHVAVTKSGTTYKSYVNGTLLLSTTTTISPAAGSAYIGTNTQASTTVPSALISNLRVVESVVYASNFSVPTTPLTAIANTKLLLSGNNSTIYSTKGDTALACTANAQISNTPTRFGSGSLSFDGTGDWISGFNPAGFANSLGDFTFECWYYQTARGSAQYGDGFITLWKDVVTPGTGLSTTNPGVVIRFGSGTNDTPNLAFYTGTTMHANINSGSTTALNTWNHIAGVKQGTAMRLFVNGVKVAEQTGMASITDVTFRCIIIGASPDGANPEFQGYIDEVRVTKGVARYTSNFVVPTQPFFDY